MEEIQETIEEDNVGFTAYQCAKCGESLLNMRQLGELAGKYRALRKAKKITFSKWGNSLAVRIPQDFAKDLDIKEGDHALLKKTESGLEIVSG
jgi:hypothetical protein